MKIDENSEKQILAAFKFIVDNSKDLNKYYLDENTASEDRKDKIISFLETISKQGREILEERLNYFKNYCFLKIQSININNSKNSAVPITNFFRYLLIYHILNDKIDYDKYFELKEKVFNFKSNSDYEYFEKNYVTEYENFKKILDIFKEKSNAKNWANKDFEILAGIYLFDKHEEKINNYLKEIGNFIIQKLNFNEDSQLIKTFNFEIQGYPQTWAFIAIHPKNTNHSNSYQIGIRIDNGDIIYGLYEGKKIAKLNNNKSKFISEKFESQNSDFFKIEEMINYLERLKSDFIKLNKAEVLNMNLNDNINNFEDKSQLSKIELKIIKDVCDILKDKKQVILYGPPGTAKTWITKEIVKSFSGKSYDELKKEQRVEFITFHQSYAYEEFVEGIKPKLKNDLDSDNNEVSYTISDGVFKEMCKNAIAKSTPNNKDKLDFNKKFFKMSLGNTLKKEQDIYQYCINNDCIALGWGGDVNYLGVKSKDEIKSKFEQKHGKMDYPNGIYSEENSPFHITAMNVFILNMKIGDYVLISEGNKILKAIGIIDGDYIYNADVDIPFHQFRSVKWLAKNLNVPVERILTKKFNQQSIYELYTVNLIQDELTKLIEDPIINVDYDQLNKIYAYPEERKKIFNNDLEPFFLIIDEINRGNISKILGELITLLENNKRLGGKEELIVKLPYSKNQFGVPPNLYIIATMNTADRSIANLDLALRRRFGFYEMTPNYDFIKENNKLEEKIDLCSLAREINKRIEIILDKDHTIGASYFANIDSVDILKRKWNFEIIPLLLEYFYNDWEKLKFVIGDKFLDITEEKDEDGENKFLYSLHKFSNNADFIIALQNIIDNSGNKHI